MDVNNDGNSGNGDIIAHIYSVLGKVVILPIPLGRKGPVFSGWQEVTFEQTQTREYQNVLREAVQRGGNLGILLGERSDGLGTIDFDDEGEAAAFLSTHPWAQEVCRTRGAHGYQIWFRAAGAPQKRIVIKSVGGKPTVEYRGGGGIQSVFFGRHPEGMRYQEVVKKPAGIIGWGEIWQWMQRFLKEGIVEEDRNYEWLKQYPGCNIRELDLIGLLKELGVICKDMGEGKYVIQCPWYEDHTMDGGALETAVWQWNKDRWPAFRCYHAHCEHRRLEHLLDLAEENKPGIVKKWCRGKGESPLPEICTYEELIAEKPKLPVEIIGGLLHLGMKMMIAGPPKMRKSWLATDLALSLAEGGVWLGFDTCQIKVLYLNMEMPKVFFDTRLYDVQRAKRMKGMPGNNFNALHLRGSTALNKNWRELVKRVGGENYGAVIVDPIYKLYGERVENAAEDMAELLHEADLLAECGPSVILIHHFAKGDSLLKDMGDRASGSGVFYRDMDAFVTVSWANKEKEVDEAKMEIRARMVPMVDPFGMRWDFPLWKRDGGIDIKKDGGNKSPKITQQQILINILKENPQGLYNKDWQRLALITYGIEANSFNKALRDIKLKGGKLPFYLQGTKYFPI